MPIDRNIAPSKRRSRPLILVCNDDGVHADGVRALAKHLKTLGRVVVVASRVAYKSAPDEGIEFDNIGGEHDYSVGKAYAHSKLANVLFSLELARQLKGSRITSNSLHPGVIDTNLVRNESRLIRTAFGIYTSVNGKTIEEGAATSCYVTTSDLLGSTSGEYFEDCNAVTVSGPHHLTNRQMAADLWMLSESLVGDYLIRHERPDGSEFERGPGQPLPGPGDAS